MSCVCKCECAHVSMHMCVRVHICVQVNLCVSMNGNQKTTSSVIPQVTPTLLFEIGPFIGLELAKQAISAG